MGRCQPSIEGKGDLGCWKAYHKALVQKRTWVNKGAQRLEPLDESKVER